MVNHLVHWWVGDGGTICHVSSQPAELGTRIRIPQAQVPGPNAKTQVQNVRVLAFHGTSLLTIIATSTSEFGDYLAHLTLRELGGRTGLFGILCVTYLWKVYSFEHNLFIMAFGVTPLIWLRET